MTKKPFWEECYQQPGKLDTFRNGKPSNDVVIAASMLDRGSTALDLGCGEGRNAVYLADIGLATTAVDISGAGIKKLNTIASQMGLDVESSVCDMRKYMFSKQFDLVICHGCLHLVKREEWQKVLERIKNNTAPGGINVICVFTDQLPEPDDQKGIMSGLFREGELLEHYQDWEILDSRSCEFQDEHPGGIRHRHALNSLTAKKPKLRKK